MFTSSRNKSLWSKKSQLNLPFVFARNHSDWPENLGMKRSRQQIFMWRARHLKLPPGRRTFFKYKFALYINCKIRFIKEKLNLCNLSSRDLEGSWTDKVQWQRGKRHLPKSSLHTQDIVRCCYVRSIKSPSVAIVTVKKKGRKIRDAWLSTQLNNKLYPKWASL